MILPQNYSHYSVLKSSLKPADIVSAAKNIGAQTAAITDLNSMAGIVQFHKECKKQQVKPALGLTCQFMDGSTVCLIALNKAGYHTLLYILSDINSKQNFVRHPQLSFEILKKYDLSNVACLTGHYGSSIHHNICEFINTEEINPEWEKYVRAHLNLLLSRFDRANVYLQIEPHFGKELLEIYQKIAKLYNLQLLYNNQVCCGPSKEDKKLFDVLRATNKKITLKGLEEEPNFLTAISLPECRANTNLEKSIEEYDILGPQVLPSFKTPDGSSSIDYLKYLCRQDYINKIDINKKSTYDARILEELDVFEEAGLADYFLILNDVIKWSENQGAFPGPGRGSSSGSLVSYLLGITKIDPIKYDLIFGRFFNKGRLGSMPDIDVDFPKKIRDRAINYTINKYGKDHAAQIVTYQTFMGRAALKAVLRAEDNVTFGEMNQITKNIEDKAKIADELQEMKDSGQEPSVILWALENRAHKLEEYVQLEDNGEITGELADQFKLAIKLEGIKSAQSKHAAGVVISDTPIREKLPVLYDPSSQQQLVGIEYEDAESLGATKYDYLSLSSLDRLADINKDE